MTNQLEARPPPCYKLETSETLEQWWLFEYLAKKQAEKAREKFPEGLSKTIGLGLIRIKK
jgi:hypothetical protein